MSIAANETDKQVGEILGAIQDITPKVVEQAMTYWWVANSVWLGIFLVVGVGLAIVFCRCLPLCKEWKSEGYVIVTFLSGWGVVFCLAGFVACIHSLVKLSIAPDYYAVECIARLLGR